MLHNLLPPLEKKAIQVEYLVRFGTVFTFLMVGAVGVGFVALIPTYVSLKADIDTIDVGVAQGVVFATSSPERIADEQTIKNLKVTMRVFETVLQEGRMTDFITAALSVRPDTIHVEGVQYDRAAKTITVEGVSTTRDALIAYARSLEDTSVFGRVPVAISDLAKNTDIHFRLVLPIETQQ